MRSTLLFTLPAPQILLRYTILTLSLLTLKGSLLSAIAQPIPLAPPLMRELPRTPSASHLEAYQNFFTLPDEQISSLFSDRFLGHVSAAQLVEIRHQYQDALGPLKRVDIVSPSAPSADQQGPGSAWGVYRLIFERGHAPTKIHLDSESLIDGLWFGVPVTQGSSYSQTLKEISSLTGLTSVLVTRISTQSEDSADHTKPKIIAAHQPDAALAVGSAFKLYILETLQHQVNRGARRASEIIHLNNSYKSLPSGILHQWPHGAELTLSTLAHLMISISDNTATDHLIHALGRASIEARAPLTMRPLLMTREAFLLKLHPKARAMRDRYLKGSLDEKRRALKTLPALSLKGVRAFTEPTDHQKIEWTATTRELCDVMTSLNFHPSLMINAGALNASRDSWSKIAYKGGSEPGVLNYTYLLKSLDSKSVYCVSATVNQIIQESKQKIRPMNTQKFTMLVQKLLSLLAESTQESTQPAN